MVVEKCNQDMGKGLVKGDKPRDTRMSRGKCSAENEFSLSPNSEDTARLSKSVTSLLRNHSSKFLGKTSNV